MDNSGLRYAFVTTICTYGCELQGVSDRAIVFLGHLSQANKNKVKSEIKALDYVVCCILFSSFS